MTRYNRVCWAETRSPRELIEFVRSKEFEQCNSGDFEALCMVLADRWEASLDRSDFEGSALDFDSDQPVPAEAAD